MTVLQNSMAEHNHNTIITIITLQANGMTVLQNSMVEHNLLAASRIYTNIKFEQLAALLCIHQKEADTHMHT
jgi:hypothetical protein